MLNLPPDSPFGTGSSFAILSVSRRVELTKAHGYTVSRKATKCYTTYRRYCCHQTKLCSWSGISRHLLSFTVPVFKGNCNHYSKTLTVDDFRGIAISPIISKAFEHCILDRFSDFFVTSNNKFGFKRHSGCSYAVYTLRSVVDYYANYGSTVNICSIDLSKAFDNMNHHALFIQLMRRNVPVTLLTLLERWVSVSIVASETSFSL